ncbi:MAG TPA: Tm-1-like ATP-binding domain-containing protein [Thermodesulfobacteriota bacterium]|nr:Tm-1-like ATP-binding domain-containing protein [Thermodesulfobacteriota bacterium]
MKPKKCIVLIGTLDTKGEEIGYLKNLILQRGHRPLVIDIGAGGKARLEADIPAAEVARAAGAEVEKLWNSRERQKVTETMIKGAVDKLAALCRTGEVEGMISVGGMTSTVMASSIMREIPYSIPKLIVSSAASMPGSNRYFGPTGITMMHSLVDVGGLNRLLKAQLNRAAGAICGMVNHEISQPSLGEHKPMVAMSVYGYVENCARYINDALTGRYEVIRFHATGMPEITMEKLVEEGVFSGVIDLVPSSITNEKFNGARISWKRRLEVAGEKGIPQVIAPAGVNTISRVGFTAEELAPELKIRKHFFMEELRVTVWLNTKELEDMASIYSEKLNMAVGPTKFLIPKRGWISIEKEGSNFYDPQAARTFVDKLKEKLKPEIEVREVDANIDDPIFAKAVVNAFEEVMSSKQDRQGKE